MSTNNDGYKIGDIVAIRGTVTETSAEQVRVEIFSKTDQYEVWIRNKDLTKLVDAEDADEPDEIGSLVEVSIPNGGNYFYDKSIWTRIDTSTLTRWKRITGSGDGPDDSIWRTWRELKMLGTVTRLYRDGEV